MENIVHNTSMNKFTVIAYVPPEGGHHVEVVEAPDATAAALKVRTKLELASAEFEVVGVIEGEARFATVDHRLLTLAPYSVASP